jgi:hypothetical protein
LKNVLKKEAFRVKMSRIKNNIKCNIKF